MGYALEKHSIRMDASLSEIDGKREDEMRKTMEREKERKRNACGLNISIGLLALSILNPSV